MMPYSGKPYIKFKFREPGWKLFGEFPIAPYLISFYFVCFIQIISHQKLFQILFPSGRLPLHSLLTPIHYNGLEIIFNQNYLIYYGLNF